MWRSTALLFTYDEAGGFFDHVQPPGDACLARPADAMFHELGTRFLQMPLGTIEHVELAQKVAPA